MKRFQNNLDERQEQALLKIEHNGCWLAFWGLLVAMAVQVILNGFDAKTLAGEWLVYMVLDIYLVIACLKAGIWDRRLRPNFKTNLLLSLAAGVGFGILIFLVSLRWASETIDGIIIGALSAIVVFVICLVALQIAAAILRRKQVMLESEDEE